MAAIVDHQVELEIIVPDDFHHHLRDVGAASMPSSPSPMRDVLQIISKKFARVLVMPNLKPPVRNFDDAMAYHARLQSQLICSETDKEAHQVIAAKFRAQIDACQYQLFYRFIAYRISQSF